MLNQTRKAPDWLLAIINKDGAPIGKDDSKIFEIQEGERNNTLFKKAAALRGQGLTPTEIGTEIQVLNQTLCNPPLPLSEVAAIVSSATKYSPNAAPAISDVLSTLNDAGNAKRLVSRFGDCIRYISERKEWLILIGGRWQWDSHNIKLNEYAQIVAKSIYSEASLVNDSSHGRLIAQHANASQNVNRLNAMISLAQKDSRVAMSVTQLDANHRLLGVSNGVIDLNTGELLDNQPEMLITKFSPVRYNKDAKCPMFMEFLSQIFEKDEKVISYVQRMLGYCLTGLTSSQVLFFFYGTGANGKSTLLNVIESLLGADFCKQVPSDVLIAKKHTGAATNGIARLHGVRVAMANEVEQNSFFDEATIKQLTGGDTVTARFLFKGHFDFKPEFKLIIVGNHKPVIQGTDDGIWRRIQMLNFPIRIPESERDYQLLGKLQMEMSGILNFAISGYAAWLQNGLQPPQSVIQDGKDYRVDMDILGDWLQENCERTQSSGISAMAVYENYKKWSEVNGLKPMSNKAFGRQIEERGIKKMRTGSGVRYLDLKLA